MLQRPPKEGPGNSSGVALTGQNAPGAGASIKILRLVLPRGNRAAGPRGALGGGQQPRQLSRQALQALRPLLLARPGLEQLVGDGQGRQDRGLVRLDAGGSRVLHLLQRAIYVLGHGLGGVGRPGGPERVLAPPNPALDDGPGLGHRACSSSAIWSSRNCNRFSSSSTRARAAANRSCAPRFSASSSSMRSRFTTAS